ncbi:parkin co-regulated protein-domain-containing protein [Zopfochytrium polystomum]|nr:parkin co-regulated protein-domain-containing protein [Zopfochytrium polystomum]
MQLRQTTPPKRAAPLPPTTDETGLVLHFQSSFRHHPSSAREVPSRTAPATSKRPDRPAAAAASLLAAPSRNRSAPEASRPPLLLRPARGETRASTAAFVQEPRTRPPKHQQQPRRQHGGARTFRAAGGGGSMIALAAEDEDASATSSAVGWKISSRLTPKAVETLGLGTPKSAYGAVYNKGGIPCRLVHGSVKHKISWTTEPRDLQYNPLFVTLCEGLRETEHPHAFLVPEALKAMIGADGARAKIKPLMAAAVAPLRFALGSRHKPVALAALDILRRLAECLGPSVLPFLGSLLPPVATQLHSRDAGVREAVTATLHGIEGGVCAPTTARTSRRTTWDYKVEEEEDEEEEEIWAACAKAFGSGFRASNSRSAPGSGGGGVDRGFGEAVRAILKAKIPSHVLLGN